MSFASVNGFVIGVPSISCVLKSVHDMKKAGKVMLNDDSDKVKKLQNLDGLQADHFVEVRSNNEL